jgi:hypothetical protein
MTLKSMQIKHLESRGPAGIVVFTHSYLSMHNKQVTHPRFLARPDYRQNVAAALHTIRNDSFLVSAGTLKGQCTSCLAMHACSSVKGDCGGMLVQGDRAVGFHVGTVSDMNVNVFVPVTAELIHKVCGKKPVALVEDMRPSTVIPLAEMLEAAKTGEGTAVPSSTPGTSVGRSAGLKAETH